MYALIALGYTLVYGILLMINFAHSELFMVGAYVGLGVLQLLTNPDTIATVTAELPFMSWLEPASAFFTGSTFGIVRAASRSSSSCR